MFGVKSVSPTYLVRFSNLDEVADAAARLWGDVVRGRRFAVRVHRWGIHNFTSLDAAAKIGAALVSAGGKVDLERPEVELYVEIRGRRAFLYTEVLKGPGGLPLGSEGKVLALVSGGIDSPVAAWMMMCRGAHVDVFYLQSRRDTCLKLGIRRIRSGCGVPPHRLSKGTPHHENRLVAMYKNCVLTGCDEDFLRQGHIRGGF